MWIGEQVSAVLAGAAGAAGAHAEAAAEAARTMRAVRLAAVGVACLCVYVIARDVARTVAALDRPR